MTIGEQILRHLFYTSASLHNFELAVMIQQALSFLKIFLNLTFLKHFAKVSQTILLYNTDIRYRKEDKYGKQI